MKSLFIKRFLAELVERNSCAFVKNLMRTMSASLYLEISMKIKILNINEALKNQNRTLIKSYTNIIFNKIKNYIENINPTQLFYKSETIQLKSNNKNIKYNANISFSNSEKPNINIHADVKSDQTSYQTLTIYIELGLSNNQQQNINILRTQYPNIVQQLQEVITHELVHINQNIQSKSKTPEGYSKRSKETLNKLQFDKNNEYEKDIYFSQHSAPNPFFSLDEIEAYAKGLVKAFQKSKNKY